ncbi:MAG: tyrosine--tRNA ligase [Candidatus Bathyarchaeota archaeon]|nr:MAG: tyrosine--tRNA ligase [Candidatus Bathyarchaeota archaeon]
MDIEGKMKLIAHNTEEIVTRDELRSLLETKTKPRAYWGFESSGLMHLGLGLVCGSKIREMTQVGFHFIIFLADWHSWINNKLGGKIENIRLCGEYFRECFTALGIRNVEYRWAAELARDIDYWEKIVKIGKSASVQRVWRALPIMGRDTTLSDVETAWLLYPLMQAADIFQMQLDVACAGMDQRKAHMLARDAAEKLDWQKPISIHTPLLMGLRGPKKGDKQLDENSKLNLQIVSKMAKSVPSTCIFVHDSIESIKIKLKEAYCPPKEVINNPVLEVARLAVFTNTNEITITRPPKYGGIETYTNYNELEKAYREEKIHPLDLKNAVAEALIQILEPVRTHFQKHPEKVEEMKKIEITR